MENHQRGRGWVEFLGFVPPPRGEAVAVVAFDVVVWSIAVVAVVV